MGSETLPSSIHTILDLLKQYKKVNTSVKGSDVLCCQ
jgi:hypothetical protein